MRFSPVRQVGLFSWAAHSTAECSWSAYGINVGIVRHSLLAAILVPLRSYFFFWTYNRSVYSNLHLRTDAVHSRSPAHLFSLTRFTTAFGRVITHFSVAKLVCSRARLKSLGQWRSFTNLPLSSPWFWRLALTKIKRIWLLSLSQPYTALTYVGSVKIILITT